MKGRATGKKRRLLRRTLWAGAIFLLVFVILIAFLPAILSTSFGKGGLEGLLRWSLGRTVEAGDVELSWAGPQRVEGLRIPSPAGFPPEKDLLRVPRAVLDAGLLGLIFSRERPLRLEVDGPAVNLIRDSGGRFNFGAPPRAEKEGEEKGRGKEPPGQGKGGGLPGISRAVSVTLKGGHLHYEDAVLRTSSDLSDIAFALDLKEDEARLEAGASIVQPGGSPGSLKAAASARGLSRSSRPVGLEIDATAEADGVDLRPYRALLEEFLQVTPPEKPVSGKVTLKTREGVLEVASSVDAGFARLTGASGEIPLERGGRPATLKVPWSVDLAPTLASSRRLAPFRETTQLAGRASGSLEVSVPATLDDLARKGPAALAQAALKLDLKTEGLKVRWTARGEGAGGAAKEPLEFSKDLSLALEARTGDTLETVEIESARLSGDGIDADLAATLCPVKGAASGGDRARALSLKASLDLIVPKLLTCVTGLSLKGLEAGEGSRIRLSGLTLSGEVGGARAASESLSGKGRLEVSGPLKYRGLQVDSEAGDIVVGGGKIDLSGASAAINGGRVDAPALVVELGPPPSYRADLKAEGVQANYDMTPFLAYVLPFLSTGDERADFNGKVQSSLKLEGKGFSREELEKSLQGGGTVRVLDGAIKGSRFFGEIEKLTGGKIAEVRFSELGSDFAIGEAKVACSKVYLKGKEGGKVRNLGLKGVTGLDGSLDYGVDLSALQETIGDKKIQKILGMAKDVLKTDVLPLKMKGNLASPKLSLEPGLEKFDLQGLLQEIPGLGGRKKSGEEKPGGIEEPSGKKEKAKKPALEDLLEDLLKKRR